MIVRNIGVENWTDAPKIKIGICAMGKKTTSKERIIINLDLSSTDTVSRSNTGPCKSCLEIF